MAMRVCSDEWGHYSRRTGMGKKGKKPKAIDPRDHVLRRDLGVPTEFFNVHTDGLRYLARVTSVHPTKKEIERDAGIHLLEQENNLHVFGFSA